ncbi:ABC transporter transmembrane domain-containing protein [Paenibacillus alkalitolerans]|uniref:ABC transporter transmembrane domain-containing protein n=1 Tax=Paenibacillus alkalitolerans TaxID=2799335 RepID=UPI0018F6D7E4|nr:ABC transporter transmembrane domain-containing protein [Paenibacillus alkalitolerans]
MKADSVIFDDSVWRYFEGKSTVGKLFFFIRKRWLQYIGLFIVLALGIVLDLSLAWYLMRTTDAAVLKEQQLFLQLIVVGLCILLLSVTVNFFDSYLKSKVANSIRNELRVMTFYRMLRLPSIRFDQSHSGELVSHLTSDNQAIGQALGNTFMMLIRSPLMAIFSFVYLLYIYWPLAIVCGLIGPLTLFVR